MLMGCGAKSSFVVVSIETGESLTTLTELRAVVVHDQKQAQVVLKNGAFDLVAGTPLSFTLKFDGSRRGTVTVEVTALRQDLEIARALTDAQLAGGTDRVSVVMMPVTRPAEDGGGPPPCGALGQTCCENDACDAPLTCVSGTCQCGAVGQPCCAGDSCNSGLVCSGAVCECGGLDQPCCTGGSCSTGHTCSNDKCVACGLSGQPCCGTLCGANLACGTNGLCGCGEAAQPCCEGIACAVGLACTGGSCASCLPACSGCGGLSQPCCNGTTCSVGTTCDSMGTCVACGAQNQPCCSGTTCGANLECKSALCVCGTKNEPCCGGTSCGSNLECQSGTCRCGGKGDPCCEGNTCNSNNLVCTAGTCQCGAFGQPCCSGTNCNTGLGCNDDMCHNFGGLSQGEDAFQTCVACRVANPVIDACGCPAGFTQRNLRATNECRGVGTFHGMQIHSCSSSTLPAGSDFGGIYEKDDLDCRTPSTCLPNPYTGSCTCPAGYTTILLRQLVDTNATCSNGLGYIGTNTGFCIASSGSIQRFGGAYQVDSASCQGSALCRVPNPKTGACSCPAQAPTKVEVSTFVSCNIADRIPSKITFCLVAD
jgi:hypothetical protein